MFNIVKPILSLIAETRTGMVAAMNGEKKKNLLAVRATDEARREIQAIARRLGVSESELVRQHITTLPKAFGGTETLELGGPRLETVCEQACAAMNELESFAARVKARGLLRVSPQRQPGMYARVIQRGRLYYHFLRVDVGETDAGDSGRTSARVKLLAEYLRAACGWQNENEKEKE